MSYCRFSEDSEVYVYESDAGFECCGCAIFPRKVVTFPSPEAMITHLALHKRSGHKVPEHAILGLWADIEDQTPE